MDESKPVDRRGFISGSFLMGMAGGAAAGAVGMQVAEKIFDPYYNERLARPSYAQGGEDRVIWSVAEGIGVLDLPTGKKPTYMDIGANDPIAGNNTYLLYKHAGSRGVLVEPNLTHCRNLEKARPQDVTLPVAIGVEEGEMDFYMIGGPGGDSLNTLDKEMAESYKTKTNGMHFIEKVVKVPVRNINRVMEEQFKGAPNILSIDIEGLDFKVLNSIDYERFRPEVICAETVVYASKKQEMEILDLMKKKDYTIRGATFVNTVFADQRKL